jgi:hypothetical protein
MWLRSARIHQDNVNIGPTIGTKPISQWGNLQNVARHGIKLVRVGES